MIIETDCLPILGMISKCPTPALMMLRSITYIKSLNPEIENISGKDNAMADMLLRAQIDDLDDIVSEDEEVGVDFFESGYVTTRKGSTPALNEFDEGEVRRGVAPNRWVPKEDDAGRGMDEGRGQPDLEESVPVLPTGRKHMETSTKERQHPTPGSGEEGRAGGVVDGVSRESLGRTLRDMGHVQKAEGEVLVVGIVLGRASVRDDL